MRKQRLKYAAASLGCAGIATVLAFMLYSCMIGYDTTAEHPADFLLGFTLCILFILAALWAYQLAKMAFERRQ